MAACDTPTAQIKPDCTTRRECDDGFTCVLGECVMTKSSVGDPCDRELCGDCGPGQTCATTGFDGDSDGEPDTLSPTCQPSGFLVASGAACNHNDECASNACEFNRCVELCMQSDDCSQKNSACVGVPYMFSPRAIDQYFGCMPASGVLAVDLPVDDTGLVHVPVPTHALSMALTLDIGDPEMIVGLTRLVSPSGQLLWNKPSPTDPIFIEQPVRYTPANEISTFMLPSSTEAPLEAGVYRVNVAAWQKNTLQTRLVPRVRATYRLGVEGRTLDVNFHFLNLADHACLGTKLNAARASEKTSMWQTEMLPAWRRTFAQAGIALGTISYDDELGHDDLDSLRPDELGALFELSDRTRPGLDVYVVRSMYPLGVLAASGGSPGPLEKGTAHSGIVVTADALCLLPYDDFGRLVAHAAARYLGLFESVDVNGRQDPLTSTADSVDNVVYFRLGDATQITEEQATILRRNPVLKMMKRRALVIALVVAVPSLALAVSTSPTAREKLTALLRSVEALPEPTRLDEASGGDASAALAALAEDDTANPQARLAALSELARYPGLATETQLRTVIDKNRNTRNGAATLYARAAALSLGSMAKTRAVPVIVPLLDHPIADVRADAARALALTGSADALPALRARRAIETSVMVKAEIAEAIGVVTP